MSVDEPEVGAEPHDGSDLGAAPVDGPEVGPDRAVVDRIVDGVTAALLVGPEERALLVPLESLPDGVREGTWVVLDLGCNPPAVREVDEELTRTRRADVQQRLERIRQERSGGRFGA